MGRHVRALFPFPWATSASNTMSSGPTSVSSGILIHPTVWPQYTNVIQTGQTGRRSRSIGRTVICSGRPKTAELTCRLVSGVEWAEAKRRRCGLMSNYFDHLLFDVNKAAVTVTTVTAMFRYYFTGFAPNVPSIAMSVSAYRPISACISKTTSSNFTKFSILAITIWQCLGPGA